MKSVFNIAAVALAILFSTFSSGLSAQTIGNGFASGFTHGPLYGSNFGGIPFLSVPNSGTFLFGDNRQNINVLPVQPTFLTTPRFQSRLSVGEESSQVGKEGSSQTSAPSSTQSIGLADRVMVMALKKDGVKSTPVPINVIMEFCADVDGCQVRLGRQATTQASSDDPISFITTHLHVNRKSGKWLTAAGMAGRDADGSNQNLLGIDNCYFADTEFDGSSPGSDTEPGFGLVSYQPYNTTTNSFPDPQQNCTLTIIN